MQNDPEAETMAVKNECFQTLKACNLNYFKNLLSLDLSMNRISSIEGQFEAANLRSLSLQDNLLREIPPKLLQKLPSLTTLHLDMNQISKLEHLHHCPLLEDLSLHQNRIQKIENLSPLTFLRKLNLSFNRIGKIEGLAFNTKLELVELGKN